MSKLAQIPIGGKLLIEVNSSPVSGLVASVGSLAVFDNVGVGEVYIKIGSLDTDWSLVGGSVDLSPYFKHDGTVAMTGDLDLGTKGIKSSNATVIGLAVGTSFVAIGDSVIVEGINAVAMGGDNTASGNGSVAMGNGNTASGIRSVAMGGSNTASGDNSFAMGNGNTASGGRSVAMGDNNTASGYTSVAMGDNNTASGHYSFAMGNNNTASGLYSVAMGGNNTASGLYSVAMGQNLSSLSMNQTTIGCGNEALGGESGSSWIATDPLFVIGNSSDNGTTLSNALVITKNAKSFFKNDMDLGSHQIKNLENGTDPQDAVALSQLDGYWKFTDSSASLNVALADAYFGTFSGDFDIKLARNNVQIINIGANSVTVTTEIVKTQLYSGLGVKAESNMIVIAPSVSDGATSLLAQLTSFNPLTNRKTKVEIFLSADGVSCSWEKIIHVTQGDLSLTVQDGFYSQDDLGVICSLGFLAGVYSVDVSSITILNGVNFRVIFTEVCSL